MGCHEILDPIQVLIEMANGYRQQDYKLEKMAEFEAKQRALNERRRASTARRMAKQGTTFTYTDYSGVTKQ